MLGLKFLLHFRAKVVLPHLRGPWTNTTGVSSKASSKQLRANRGYMIGLVMAFIRKLSVGLNERLHIGQMKRCQSKKGKSETLRKDNVVIDDSRPAHELIIDSSYHITIKTAAFRFQVNYVNLLISCVFYAVLQNL